MANALPAFANMTQGITEEGSRIEHGAIVPRSKRKCPDCGEVSRRKKGQKRIARCQPCAKTHRARYAREYRVGWYYQKRYGADWRVALCPKCGEKHERKKNQERHSMCRSCLGEAKAQWRETSAEKRRIERAVNKKIEETRQRLDSG